MYEVSKEIRENILDQIVEELEERCYDYSENALNAILDEWFAQKNGLMEVLSKHPNWNPEELMIRFDKDYEREIDINVAYNFINWLHRNTNMNSVYYKEPENWWTTRSMYDSMCYILTRQTFLPIGDPTTQQELEWLNKMNENFKFREGQKATKIMRKICATYGWDKIMKTEYLFDGTIREYNAFEREYAKYCDAMCPIKVIRHTCISVNPLDFLLMSNGNSWDSCHYIGESGDSGCYSSGTISYMLDKHSMVFYTVSGDYNGDEISRQPKINRQVFGYNDNQLLQSRLYPQSCDGGHQEIYKDIREIMQKVIADCEGKPNLWIKKKVQNVLKGKYATVYDDWRYFENLCCISVFSDCAEKQLEPLTLGAQPICIGCGGRHRTCETINCCNDGRYTCAECGARIWEDDVCWVGDTPYCGNCARYCGCCGEYELAENTTWLDYECEYVCNDCLEENYVMAADINQYVYESNATWIESEQRYITNIYRNQCYEICRSCGEWFRREDMVEKVEVVGQFDWGTATHNVYYCSECHKENVETREEMESIS
ncbi:MAG: hypothetical protein IJD91_06875 [Clostridia bacterium]|nr:hypothetical protein [Clostridia bacterium]